MQREQALHLVYDVIDVVNRQLPASRRLAKAGDTIIVGPSGSLDSLGIVNFVIALEERASDVLRRRIELFNGAALDERTPFRSVETIARFLETLE